MLSLSKLLPGQFGKVVALNSEREVDQRLMALGLLPGMVVKVERRAPLGDPISLSFGGLEICLRQDEARDIFVDLSADCPIPRRKS
ncbi:MAG: FeoA family protein [Opitutales bacterium]